MENYIRVYDNIVSPEFCDGLIKKFEDNPQYQEKLSKGLMSLTHMEIMRPDTQIFNDDIMHLVEKFQECIKTYKSDCNIEPVMWPQKYSFESFRMKRYIPDGTDQFGPHVDAKNIETCKRFLVFFCYLTDNLAGDTTFPQMGISSECKKGSLLMFPPMWPWLHSGEKPIETPKYILGSYLKFEE